MKTRNIQFSVFGIFERFKAVGQVLVSSPDKFKIIDETITHDENDNIIRAEYKYKIKNNHIPTTILE